jgi:hypothetical protein
MCIRHEMREKARRTLALSPVSKPHKHITYMLRQCTSIVYICIFYWRYCCQSCLLFACFILPCVFLYCAYFCVRFIYCPLMLISSVLYQGPSWSWWYGSWINNYLCNQFLSPLKFVSSNSADGKVYSIQHYVIKFVLDVRQ